jgi:hypothetical protein
MNRLNQTESATFLLLNQTFQFCRVGISLGVFIFSILKKE